MLYARTQNSDRQPGGNTGLECRDMFKMYGPISTEETYLQCRDPFKLYRPIYNVVMYLEGRNAIDSVVT